MRRRRNLADRGHGNVHERCQIDQIHIDEAERFRQRRERRLQEPGLAYPESLLRQPQRGAEAAIEQPPRLVTQRAIDLPAGWVEQEHVDVPLRAPA